LLYSGGYWWISLMCCWSLWGYAAHMILVAVFLFLGQHLRLEDNILD
jgi:hypothetical protein